MDSFNLRRLHERVYGGSHQSLYPHGHFHLHFQLRCRPVSDSRHIYHYYFQNQGYLLSCEIFISPLPLVFAHSQLQNVQKGLVILRCFILSTQISLFIASVYFYTRGEITAVDSASTSPSTSTSNHYFQQYYKTLSGFRIVFFLISCLVLFNSIVIYLRSRRVSTPNSVGLPFIPTNLYSL